MPSKWARQSTIKYSHTSKNNLPCLGAKKAGVGAAVLPARAPWIGMPLIYMPPETLFPDLHSNSSEAQRALATGQGPMFWPSHWFIPHLHFPSVREPAPPQGEGGPMGALIELNGHWMIFSLGGTQALPILLKLGGKKQTLFGSMFDSQCSLIPREAPNAADLHRKCSEAHIAAWVGKCSTWQQAQAHAAPLLMPEKQIGHCW